MATSDGDEISRSSTAATLFDGHVSCSPCDVDGKKLEAVGYCTNCKEYLCEMCFKYHRLPSVTRHHVLLDQGHIENAGALEEMTNTCPLHTERLIEYHCPTHAFFGCHVCCFTHQKQCKDSRYIADVARTFVNSDEFNGFAAKLDIIDTKTTAILHEAGKQSESIKSRFTDEVEAIKAFKLQLFEAIEKQEREWTRAAEDIKKSEEMNLETIVNKCTEIQEANLCISTESDVLQNKRQDLDLYIHVANSKDKLLSLEDELLAVLSDNAPALFKFEGSVELLETLKSRSTLGKFINLRSISTVEYVTEINVKSHGDDDNCCIRGSVTLPNSKLVISDVNKKKIKLIDSHANRLISEIKLAHSPRSVTKVTNTTVGVAIPDQRKIIIVTTEPTFSIDRELDVKDECHGVAYCDGKFVVTFGFKNKVEIIDLQGSVLRVIEADSSGKSIFKAPLAAAINPKSKVVYISNRDGHSVVSMNLDGDFLATYKDNDLRSPFQTSVDSTGNIWVTGNASKNVHLITSDCKKIKVALDSTCGVSLPHTLSYDHNLQKLFVGDGSKLKVYRVSYTVL